MLQRSRNLREYPRKQILSRIPSQFIGIAKQVSKKRKQRMMSQQIFDNFTHEVSSIEKINRTLEKNITKKKKELKFALAVRARFIQDSLIKQKLTQHKKLELDRLRNHTLQQKQSHKQKVWQSKQRLQNHKKSESTMTKKQLNNYKSQKLFQQSRMQEINHSRVKNIQEDKRKIKEDNIRFYVTRNKKAMEKYRDKIKQDFEMEEGFRNDMRKLEAKLVILKEHAEGKEKMLKQLQDSIDGLREQSRQSLRSSRKSTRSMTPLQILNLDNPENPKLRLIMKRVSNK